MDQTLCCIWGSDHMLRQWVFPAGSIFSPCMQFLHSTIRLSNEACIYRATTNHKTPFQGNPISEESEVFFFFFISECSTSNVVLFGSRKIMTGTQRPPLRCPRAYWFVWLFNQQIRVSCHTNWFSKFLFQKWSAIFAWTDVWETWAITFLSVLNSVGSKIAPPAARTMTK